MNSLTGVVSMHIHRAENTFTLSTYIILYVYINYGPKSTSVVDLCALCMHHLSALFLVRFECSVAFISVPVTFQPYYRYT